MSKSHLYFLSDHQAEERGIAREEWARGNSYFSILRRVYILIVALFGKRV